MVSCNVEPHWSAHRRPLRSGLQRRSAASAGLHAAQGEVALASQWGASRPKEHLKGLTVSELRAVKHQKAQCGAQPGSQKGAAAGRHDCGRLRTGGASGKGDSGSASPHPPSRVE